MQIIHLNEYIISNNNSKHIRFAIINDLQFSKVVTDEKLQSIINCLKNIQPDYILFPGDLIDSLNMIDDEIEKTRLLLFLEKLGFIAPTILSYGNHDNFRKDFYGNKNKFKWVYCFSDELYSKVNNIRNVRLLNNESWQSSSIYVTGHTQTMEYYEPKNTRTEDKKEMIKSLKKIKSELINLPENKIKIILSHSPIYLQDTDIRKKLKEYNLIISGHMHNGCVPPILDEICPSDRGFIAPNKKLFPKLARSPFGKTDDKLIVNGPLTMFSDASPLFSKLNFLFPPNVTILDFPETYIENQNEGNIYKKSLYKKY